LTCSNKIKTSLAASKASPKHFSLPWRWQTSNFFLKIQPAELQCLGYDIICSVLNEKFPIEILLLPSHVIGP